MRRTVLPGLAVAALLTAGLGLLDVYPRFLLAQLAVVVIAVVSLNLLNGVAGMLSLASAAFMGVGGYGVLILLDNAGIPLAASVPLTLVTGWLAGWLMGLVAVRVSGLSLAIVTFGFVEIFQVFTREGGDLAGDGYGLVVPRIVIPGAGPLTRDIVTYGCVFAACVVVVLTVTLTRSRVGRAWHAIKDHPAAAEMQGVNLPAMRAQAFATAGAMATLAGILQAFLLGITNPSLYTIDNSIGHVAMMIVGGASGSVVGAVLGPALLFLARETLDLGQYREVLYGAALLGTLVLAPSGLAGAWFYLARHARRALRR